MDKIDETDRATPATEGPAGRDRARAATRSFEESAARLLAPLSRLPWWAKPLRSLVIPAIFIGLGVGARLVAPAPLPVAVAVCAAVTAAAMMLVCRGSSRQMRDVDWSTADPYWNEGAHQVPVGHREVLAQAISRKRARYPAVSGIHPYLLPCPASVEDGSCDHLPCTYIGMVRVAAGHCVVVVGRRAFHMSRQAFEGVVWHEMRHHTGVMRGYGVMQVALGIAGWFAVGYLTFGWPSAIMLWLALAAIAWIHEVICDTSAGRAAGADAICRALAWKAAALRATPLLPRLGHLLTEALAPTHPPSWMRSLVARALVRR
ncbi:hypothetical protein [Acrocarpospora sp. B8E8]|uniref:hypothetical protein n=1 Tax=Acrocarpospora sp. B8E8 TaxID=3153572 RepID=UPI00325EAACE